LTPKNQQSRFFFAALAWGSNVGSRTKKDWLEVHIGGGMRIRTAIGDTDASVRGGSRSSHASHTPATIPAHRNGAHALARNACRMAMHRLDSSSKRRFT